MTCFWDGILRSLNNKDFELIGLNKKPNIKDFIIILKNNNKKNIDIEWQNKKLTNKNMEENYEHVKDFDINTINNGYLTSTCDPFLILICDLFKVDIRHKYLGIIINYTIKNARKTLSFKSSKSHFDKGF